MATKYSSTSSYSKTPVYDKYMGTYVPPISKSTTNLITIEITAKYNHRPDLLAYDMYEDGDLWWIFTLYNRDTLLDPIYDFSTGKIITVPKTLNNAGL